MIFKHIDSVTTSAIFSKCGLFRYILSAESKISNGKKTVCAIMQNPSDANAEFADKSVQFLERLIFEKEYEEFTNVKKLIIVNQFAYIQTNDFIGAEKYIGHENEKYISDAINESDIVLIAWGSSNPYEERKQAINSIIAKYSEKILLQTKIHPSRGTYVDFVRPYKYCD